MQNTAGTSKTKPTITSAPGFGPADPAYYFNEAGGVYFYGPRPACLVRTGSVVHEGFVFDCWSER